jgi:PIN domain nuclease of toxin-antitoxin system
VWLSHGSIWEIAIEHALARTDMPLSAAQAISS